MKILIGLLVLATSAVTFANDKEAYAKMAKQCLDEVSVQVSIGISQASHQAEEGSSEARHAQRDKMELAMLMDISAMAEKMCVSNEQYRLDCQIKTREMAIKGLVDGFNAREIKDDIDSCKLID